MIPIIDFSDYGLNVVDTTKVSADELKRLGQQVKDAFSSAGVCYIKNHGIDENLITKYKDVSREFFQQSSETKQTIARGTNNNFGWVAVGRESLNPERPGDFKEAFNFFPPDAPNQWAPFPEFQSVSRKLFDDCSELCFRMCDIISIGLNLPKDFMRKAHALIGQRGNPTTIRTLYYPPIPEETRLKPNQIRLGEHSDYGTITFLFQDDIGGLQAEVPGVGYVPATPIPGTMLVNIGDLMQRWTADELVATKHRILIPEEEFRKKNSRQSIAFFVHPDNDFIIKCLDGSDKYEPVTCIDYLNYRFSVTYLY